MKRVGIVYLIAEVPEAKGVMDAAVEIRRKTYCEEKSLSMSEVYQARSSGHSPTIRLTVPQDFEYRGEPMCEYKGERYRIIRDYRDEKSDSTELTLERIRGNAAAPAGEAAPADTSGEAAPADEPDAAADDPDAPATGGGDG